MQFPTQPHIAIIGLGYVGLPLAIEFGKHFRCTGFDIQASRIDELKRGLDSTLEISAEEFTQAQQLTFTSHGPDLESCDIYIVTVPTPIDSSKQPNLRPLEKASALIGSVIAKGNIAIFESTVFPGCTEEVCVPLIEQESGLQCNQDFFAGYSPERINPGDKQHRLPNITKVTSGSTPEAANYIDWLYGTIIVAGTHKASCIKVAEAAKVIENTQRDINIALINELAIIFNRIGIDTLEVLEAAGTKWNFLPFRPGLVGGHCISVDPYYLTHKAQQLGYHPEVILSGRKINDGMGKYVADSVIKMMTQRRIHVVESNILIMGLTFKENCPDLRNTRVVDIIEELKTWHANVDVYDPWAAPDEAKAIYDIELVSDLTSNQYDAIIICVAHDEIKSMGAEAIRQLGSDNHVLYDVKQLFDPSDVDGRL